MEFELEESWKSEEFTGRFGPFIALIPDHL
jgi:hypothetical protein